MFLASLAALNLTLVGQWPFRTLTQRVTFETKRQKDKKTKRQKDKKTKRQKKEQKRKDEKMKRQDKKDKNTKKRRRQKDKKTKTKKRIWYCDVRAVSHSCDVFFIQAGKPGKGRTEWANKRFRF